MPRCAFCGSEVEVIDRVGRLDECPTCHRDLHACLQCRLYDRGSHNQCRESQAGYVGDKERANFCEFFTFGRDVAPEKGDWSASKRELEALFKKR